MGNNLFEGVDEEYVRIFFWELSELYAPDRVRSMGNRLHVETGRPSGKPGSLFLVIPNMCEK